MMTTVRCAALFALFANMAVAEAEKVKTPTK